jgi:cation:H+ antiporter
MMLPIIAVVIGLALLVWSADRFVGGAAATARHLGMPSLLIGMVVIGFGTSVPEMIVSALASFQGNPGLALGNAYGSNITNIALILGLSALIRPIAVHSQVLRKELPILTAVTALAALQLCDGSLSRLDAGILLAVFAALMAWAITQGLRQGTDPLGGETEDRLGDPPMPRRRALIWLIVGLALLIVASRLLVWGAVAIAHRLGVDDLIIGLTVVALGTSLPELASSIAAIRKHEHELALGNILGSNLFNTLAVVGIAGAIHPLDIAPELLSRDVLTMGFLTLSLFAIGYGRHGRGRVNRYEGAFLLACYVAYMLHLMRGLMAAPR